MADDNLDDNPDTMGVTDAYQEETSEGSLHDVTIDPIKEDFQKDSSYTAQWDKTYYSSPKFMAHSLTLSGGYIAVDFYVYIPEAENLADNDGTKVVFTLNGQETESALNTAQKEEVSVQAAEIEEICGKCEGVKCGIPEELKAGKVRPVVRVSKSAKGYSYLDVRWTGGFVCKYEKLSKQMYQKSGLSDRNESMTFEKCHGGDSGSETELAKQR